MLRRWLALTHYLYALSHFYFNPLYCAGCLSRLIGATACRFIRQHGFHACHQFNQTRVQHGGDDIVDFFVGLRGFFKNQRFVFADHHAAEYGLTQAVGGIFVRQPSFAFAALPFPACAVRQ